jgi:hypothetical protein
MQPPSKKIKWQEVEGVVAAHVPAEKKDWA